jgi:hypothetical protein
LADRNRTTDAAGRRWDQGDLIDDDCAGSKIAPRQTLPLANRPRRRYGGGCDEGAAATDNRRRRRRRGDARAQPDEEARGNAIDALRELLAARFGSPPELPDRTGSDSLELTIAA